MFPFVLCPTCGSPIGDKEDLFFHMRAVRAAAALAARGTPAGQADIDAGLQIDCADIFDALAIREDCCRAHLATAMRFEDYY